MTAGGSKIRSNSSRRLDSMGKSKNNQEQEEQQQHRQRHGDDDDVDESPQHQKQEKPKRREHHKHHHHHDNDQQQLQNCCCNMYKIGRLERIHDDLFVLHCTSTKRLAPQMNRNMVIMRHHKRELTLVNPIRLDEDGERMMLKLGRIARIIRLAPRHGYNHDLYYIQRFPSVRRWSPAPATPPSSTENIQQQQQDDGSSPLLPVDRLITDDNVSGGCGDSDTSCILPGCHVFFFRGTVDPECALLILRDYAGNILVTANALQSHRYNPYINVVAKASLAANGMLETDMVIPPSWLRNTVSASSSPLSSRRRQKGSSAGCRKGRLRDDFDRLLRLDFERFIGSTGVMVHERAKEETVMAVEQAFPPQWN